MLSRRDFALAFLFGAPLPSLLRAQEYSWQDVLREASIDTADPVFLGAEPLPADDPRWQVARDLLDSAPTAALPFEIARYFDRAVPEEFQRRWPSAYANPLITWFFLETRTKPTGDLTPWCAAFVSWCLERAGVVSARSAASKDYRDWSTPVWQRGEPFPGRAQIGDITVFKQLSNPNQGHVAFYIGPDPYAEGRVMVLGGNQTSSGAVRESNLVSEVSMRIDANLELHSIRAVGR
jgi:uncharacterized protein (TIGR02594 family)